MSNNRSKNRRIFLVKESGTGLSGTVDIIKCSALFGLVVAYKGVAYRNQSLISCQNSRIIHFCLSCSRLKFEDRKRFWFESTKGSVSNSTPLISKKIATFYIALKGYLCKILFDISTLFNFATILTRNRKLLINTISGNQGICREIRREETPLKAQETEISENHFF